MLAACGSAGETSAPEPTRAATAADGLDQRIAACTDRLLAGGHAAGDDEELVRRYAERTYCRPFAEKGWVYEDGALAIAAYAWLEAGSEEECAEARVGEPPRTVRCEEIPGEDELDCGLLRHVRRSEVAAYVEQLRRVHGDLRCDDGTPVDELGVP